MPTSMILAAARVCLNPYRSYFGDNGGFTRIATADPATGKGERWRCVGTRFVPGEREGQTTLRTGEFYDFEFQQWLGFTETDPKVSAQRVYYTDTFRIKLGSPGLYIVNNDELNAKLSAGGAATAPPVRAFKGIAPENVISTSGVLVDSSGQGLYANTLAPGNCQGLPKAILSGDQSGE